MEVGINDRNWLTMVSPRHEKDAKFLHNYKLDRKIRNEWEENKLFNPDLSRTKREATFEKRNEIKKNKKNIKNLKKKLKIRITVENLSM